MSDLNSEISKVFHEKEEIENKARQLELRIKKIEGTSNLLPPRKYGEPISEEAIKKNITLASLIDKNDRELATYLGVVSNRHREEEERKAAAALQAEAMRLATEKLRSRNQAAAKQRELADRQGISSVTGRSLI